MYVYLRGNRVSLPPSKSIGKGGEADVFLLDDKAVKIFKPPDHPDFNGFPQEQAGAKLRIAEHQKKLRAFPKNFPSHVITPEELVTDASGQNVLGYTMKFLNGAEPLLRYSDIGFRQAGIKNEEVTEIFRDLHQTVAKVHSDAKAIIGDFNDLNVLILGKEAFVIDADSFQFGSFYCRMFTARFVDPILCDLQNSGLMLTNPHNFNSDWYAFSVMLMQCLLFVDPYGGIYMPKDQVKRIPQGRRIFKRITVFNPEVRYPKPAIPYSVLPDDLLQYFHRIFEKDERGEFPLKLLDVIRWTRCINCGTEYARSVCPNCAMVSPLAIKEIVTVRGKVLATRIFKTDGTILFAVSQEGKLNWLYHENGQYRREDKTMVFSGDLDPQIRFRIQKKATLLGKQNQIIIFEPDQKPEKIIVDCYGNLPMFDANENFYYWLQDGRILRNGRFGPEFIGDVLSGQTLFWTGPKFGFGFYRAGNLSVAFIFDAERPGVNDSVKLPAIRGQLIDSTCVFTKERCWFFVSSQEGSKIINRCAVIKADGSVEATAEAESGDGSWLSNIRGKCAAGNLLLVATDDGIVRVESENGMVIQTKEFPDTEHFVNAHSYLFAGKEALYTVGRQEIHTLKIE